MLRSDALRRVPVYRGVGISYNSGNNMRTVQTEARLVLTSDDARSGRGSDGRGAYDAHFANFNSKVINHQTELTVCRASDGVGHPSHQARNLLHTMVREKNTNRHPELHVLLIAPRLSKVSIPLIRFKHHGETSRQLRLALSIIARS